MTRAIALIQLGVGQVGREVAQIVTAQVGAWRERCGMDVRYAALADSSAFVLPADTEGVDAALAARSAGTRFDAREGALPLREWRTVLERALSAVAAPADLVMLDCAAGPGTAPLLLAARAAGAHAVLANKDPLAGPMAQLRALTERKQGGSLRFSATVGAGLPVIATLGALIASGDSLHTLDARASGSLGFICDRLSQGERFDDAVREAVAQGYTEPDPRLDLSGFDVARKLLILARVAGMECELRDVSVASLVPPGAEALDRAEFLAALPTYRDFLADRVADAQRRGEVLRYVGRIAADGRLSASLVAFAPDDPFALGGGPENVFRLRTARYDAYPLTISGPGAGVAVTAGAVVADLLRALEVLPC